ncbi:SDR family NAD(P)-dependent oxidoreductase [Ramlibacter sp.]|uniref:SDR family NAD(P)-dependent oxidoreductase n=1 Tax=Ramlibacter sp. TaxID=1917967 RepID=UPI003D09B79D
MTQDMAGKVVVVTGAGGGIGREIALAMAKAGGKVVVNDLGVSITGEVNAPGAAQQVVNEIKAAGGEAVADTHSVAEWDSAHAIVQTALDTFGRIDCVVNNAGILRDRMFFRMNAEEWKSVIDVHLNGAFYVSRAAATHFKEQGSGSYVHMSSSAGLVGNLGQTNYGAAKIGIAGLSKNIAVDMAKFNVRSNCICPFAFTRMVGSIPTDTPEKAEKVRKVAAAMTAAQIAPMAVYLGSDLAAEVNAQVFAVRGNEIILMSQPRPLRSVHRSGGWTPKDINEHAMVALKPDFYGLEKSSDVFNWEPV